VNGGARAAAGRVDLHRICFLIGTIKKTIHRKDAKNAKKKLLIQKPSFPFLLCALCVFAVQTDFVGDFCGVYFG
jgi:hypothetical protein